MIVNRMKIDRSSKVLKIIQYLFFVWSLLSTVFGGLYLLSCSRGYGGLHNMSCPMTVDYYFKYFPFWEYFIYVAVLILSIINIWNIYKIPNRKTIYVFIGIQAVLFIVTVFFLQTLIPFE
jgi:hypothetical protein